jgi:hypothetical protein
MSYTLEDHVSEYINELVSENLIASENERQIKATFYERLEFHSMTSTNVLHQIEFDFLSFRKHLTLSPALQETFSIHFFEDIDLALRSALQDEDAKRVEERNNEPAYRDLVLLLDHYLHPTETEINNSPLLRQSFSKAHWMEQYRTLWRSANQSLKNFRGKQRGWMIDDAFINFKIRVNECYRENETIVGIIKGDFLSTPASYVKEVIYDLYNTIDITRDLTPSTKAYLGISYFDPKETILTKAASTLQKGDVLPVLGAIDTVSKGSLPGGKMVFVRFVNGAFKNYPEDYIVKISGEKERVTMLERLAGADLNSGFSSQPIQKGRPNLRVN